MSFSKHDWTPLLQFVERRKVIPVVGADLLSIRQGEVEVPWISYLAGLLAEALDVSPDGAAPSSLHEVTCRYLENGGDIDHVYSALMEVTPEETAPVPEPLKKLAEIDAFNLFVTTNFDRLLERAIDEVRFGGERRTRDFAFSPEETGDLDREATELEEPAVFHLFGRLAAIPSYAVTEEDILEWLHALQSENRRPQRLFDALSQCHLLILASGFSDWLARFFIRTTKRQPLTRRRNLDVVVDERLTGDSGLVVFLEHFSAKTKIFPGSAVDFVDELNARWKAWSGERPKAAVAAAAEPPDELKPGAIFLSYASEDRAIAQRLASALEQAGLDVWFDKEDLTPGGKIDPTIKRRIERAAFVLALVSKTTLTSERRYFRLEWREALRNAEMARWDLPFVVPVAIDDTEPTTEGVEPEFAELSWHRLPHGEVSRDFVDRMRALYRNVERARAPSR